MEPSNPSSIDAEGEVLGLAGRRVVVTGASSGIGRATALRLAADGARILAVDRDAVGLEALAHDKLVRDTTGEIIRYAADLSEPGAIQGYAEAARDAFGSVDGLFNNAGIEGFYKPIQDLGENEWRTVMAINLDALFLGLKYVVPIMARDAAVVNTASTLGLVAAPDRVDYVVSKHAVVGLTRAAAVELAARQIRVNCICPGPIDTPMMARDEARAMPEHPEQQRRQLEREIPIGRYGDPVEVARLVSFLLAPGMGYITGAVISVDGAFVAT